MSGISEDKHLEVNSKSKQDGMLFVSQAVYVLNSNIGQLQTGAIEKGEWE